jgi:conjugal transfer pilus assembly protein TraB
MLDNLKEKWRVMDPKRKQHAVWAVAGVLLLGFGWYIFGEPSKAPQHRAATHARVANELLPSSQARELGMTSLAGSVKALNNDQRKIGQDVDRLKGERQAELSQSKDGAEKDAARKNAEELASLRREIEEMKAAGQGGSAQAAVPVAGAPGQLAPMAGRPGSAPLSSLVPTTGVHNRVIVAGTGIAGSGQVGLSGTAPVAASPAQSVPAAKKEDPVPTQYLPSGSLLEGVNITGMDAPTGKQATKDPLPMLVRVKVNAILPNRYRADVRECFVVASGHGDLASERAYIRAVSISCIRHDKRVIDVPIEMVAIGPDGKAGVRGRLVSKQGQVIAKASLAGIAQGVSQAFSGSNVRLNLGDDNVDYGAGLKSGAGEGVGSAFDRIAKYYLDMADQMFPVVEIDAGQKITFMLTKGAQMGVLK